MRGNSLTSIVSKNRPAGGDGGTGGGAAATTSGAGAMAGAGASVAGAGTGTDATWRVIGSGERTGLTGTRAGADAAGFGRGGTGTSVGAAAARRPETAAAETPLDDGRCLVTVAVFATTVRCSAGAITG